MLGYSARECGFEGGGAVGHGIKSEKSIYLQPFFNPLFTTLLFTKEKVLRYMNQ